MGVFRLCRDKSAVKSVEISSRRRHFGRLGARRALALSCLAVVVAFTFTQFVPHGNPAVAARANLQRAGSTAVSNTPQRTDAGGLAASTNRAEITRIASSLRDEALRVAQGDASARARARALAKAKALATARATARRLAHERAIARQHALAKSHLSATPKVTTTRKAAAHTNGKEVPLVLSLAANVAPNPNFMATCATPSNSFFCLNQEVDAIDNARTSEGLAPLTLNLVAFSQLNGAQQVFVLTNLERTSRGLTPAMVLTSQLDAESLAASVATTDPTLNGWTLSGGKQAIAWNSNWAGGMSATEADYYWMYSDGTGYNVDCTASVTTGCWEHRQNVLATPTQSCPGAVTPQFVMGTAVTDTSSYSPSEAEILVQVCGGLPTDPVFSWPQAERLLGITGG